MPTTLILSPPDFQTFLWSLGITTRDCICFPGQNSAHILFLYISPHLKSSTSNEVAENKIQTGYIILTYLIADDRL